MKLKHGKKYETADGVVYRVMNLDQPIDDLTFESSNCYYNDLGVAVGVNSKHNLIRRHYRKPKPAHKLDLKKGDVVELVAWEDEENRHIGKKYTFNGENLKHSNFGMFPVPSSLSKGRRPLFRVVSRA